MKDSPIVAMDPEACFGNIKFCHLDIWGDRFL